MNKSSMDASVFLNNTIIYNYEFEKILMGVIACYYSMISTNIALPFNDENEIRNIMLFEYLKNKKFKEMHPPLDDYHFDLETHENKGRADIRILPINNYIDDYSYYIIECKRLDDKNQNGKTGLNGKYITNGIKRFISGKYSSYKKTAGMIGFVVTNMDVHQNVLAINNLLKNKFSEVISQKELTRKQLISEFEYSYYSKHNTENSTIIIYHLMFDFS